MEYSLAQQRESCPAKSHPFNELELVHFSLDDPIALGEGESGQHSRFISFNAAHEPLQFSDVAVSNG